MIGIDRYIEQTRSTHSHPRISEKSWFLDYAREQDNLGITLVELYSTNVYPEHIHFEGKDYVLWDCLFWDFYERFLLACWCLENKHDVGCLDKYLSGLVFQFLSFRFERNPMASLYFAEKYQNALVKCREALILKPLPFNYRLDFASGSIHGSAMETVLKDTIFPVLMEMTKVLVFFHECSHVAIARFTDDEREAVRNSIRQIVKIMNDNNLLYGDFNENQNHADELHEAMKDAIAKLEYDDFVDELMSDKHAYEKMYEWIKTLYPNKDNNHHWGMTQMVFRFLFSFIALFNSAESFWDIFFLALLKPASRGDNQLDESVYNRIGNVNASNVARQIIVSSMVKLGLSQKEKSLNYYSKSAGISLDIADYERIAIQVAIDTSNFSLVDELRKRPLLLENYIGDISQVIELRNKILGWV
jgi:hypothetical protein